MSSSSTMHSHFLRSSSAAAMTAATVQLPTMSECSSMSSSPQSDRSDTEHNGRTSKKKHSIWHMFSRGSRKCANTVDKGSEGPPMSLSNLSTLNLDIPWSSRCQGGGGGSVHAIPLPSPSALSSASVDLTSPLGADNLTTNITGGRPLRSQMSLHTLRSPQSPSRLRAVKSHYALRLPGGVPHFDTDSIFSDDSEGEVSVSWITSKGLRKVGLDMDEDERAMDLRR